MNTDTPIPSPSTPYMESDDLVTDIRSLAGRVGTPMTSSQVAEVQAGLEGVARRLGADPLGVQAVTTVPTLEGVLADHPFPLEPVERTPRADHTSSVTSPRPKTPARKK